MLGLILIVLMLTAWACHEVFLREARKAEMPVDLEARLAPYSVQANGMMRSDDPRSPWYWN